MGLYIPLSCTIEFKNRVHDHFKPGEFSRWLVELASKDMDRMDGITAIQNQKNSWFSRTVKPAILEHAGGSDLFPLRESKKLFKHLNESGIEISAEDIRLCVDELMHEVENG